MQFPVTEDHPTRPISPYGAAKLVAESYCQFYQTLGLDTVILRYFHVYGPRQRCGDDDGGVVGIFCRRAVQGLPLIVHGDGKQVRCFTYVKDVVEVNKLAMNGLRPGMVYNVCSGERVNVFRLPKLLGSRIKYGKPRSHDVKDWDVSGRLSRIFDWTPFEEGLAKTLVWYKEQYGG
jgi:nucleoside-diphosphate-sugar epimerase